MRFGDEALGVAEWVVGTITADAEIQALLGVTTALAAAARTWDSVAPEGTPFPFIIFQIGDGTDWNPVGLGDRLMVTFPVTVRATDKAESYAATAPIARRLYALLTGNHNAPVSQGGLILTGRRATAIQYPEQVNGIEYRHIGGLFSIITQ